MKEQSCKRVQGLTSERRRAFFRYILGNQCLSLTDKAVFVHLWKHLLPSGEYYISLSETAVHLRMSKRRVYWSLKRISHEVMARPEREAEQRFDELLSGVLQRKAERRKSVNSRIEEVK